MDDTFDEFLGYDSVMGADMVKCPHCGVDVPHSLFLTAGCWVGSDQAKCLVLGGLWVLGAGWGRTKLSVGYSIGKLQK